MKKIESNILFKSALILIIVLLLLIPASMIRELIREREQTQIDAISEVSSKWSEAQTITGPVVSIPYYRYVRQLSNNDSTVKIIQVKEYIHFLPDVLKVDGEIEPERRYRGIYEVVVYNSKLNFSGSFSNINFKNLDIPLKDIQLDKAFVSAGINDLRGIESLVELNWNEETFSFSSGTVTNDITGSGINTNVPIKISDNFMYNFSFSLNLKGSQWLYFVPVGKITNIHLQSKWENPGFNGAFLPDSRKIDESGFHADWNIIHLNRNYPQNWIGNQYSVNESAFGVDLLLPVDNYQKSMRSIKYAILFIALTFLIFFFVEILNKKFIHPIQYILVGLALVLFFSILIALSEHMSYNLAYLVSSISTVLLIAGYVKAILKSLNLTLMVSGILSILYGFIFVIIQLQDYSLLIGSIGLFIILGLVMYISRKIDWYNIYSRQNTE